MATNPRRLRAADVPDLDVPDHLSGYELVDGVLVPVMPSKRRHSWLVLELAVRLRAHAHGVRTGVVYADVWCRMPVPGDAERLRAPDVAYFGNERIAEAGDEEIFPFPPDLAIEVYSPSNLKRMGDFQQRVRDYVDTGTPLLWVIYPDARYAMVHLSDGRAWMIREQEALDGRDVLPGLRIELEDLFDGMP